MSKVEIGTKVVLNKAGEAACCGDKKAGDVLTINEITSDGFLFGFAENGPRGWKMGLFNRSEFDLLDIPEDQPLRDALRALRAKGYIIECQVTPPGPSTYNL